MMSGSGSMSCGVSTANVGKETSTAGDKTLLMRQPTPGQALSDAGSTDGGPTEGPPTPTHSESQDCLDARKSMC